MVQKPSAISIEPVMDIRDLTPDRILKLQAKYEGVRIFQNVSPKDLSDWKDRYPEAIENPKIRIEYNFLSKSLAIKCNLLATQAALQIFFNSTVLLSLREKIEVSEMRKRVTVGSGTTFIGFKGNWTWVSEKLPDAYIQLQNALPALGAEAGDDQASQDEKTVIDSIDEAIKLNDLAEKLIELNQAGQLSSPLVGKLGATIYGYRASEDGLDIVSSFQETLLPQKEADRGILTDFLLTMRDLLSESLPEGQDPGERITLSLAILVEFIERLIPHTEHFRAYRRAETLLRKAGVWGEEEEIFA
ncbi:hypothetical protein B9Z19DRAFT_1196481 [Tuber borchii]|uniref:Uncharacterized protein n=1 Tax=Tuber borchii TaxID=42251 RepID=A0A2T6ZF20_TUBBO|nr:hypothetical protein B9Z19DRAFT_1196481 [Tuber borchii]